MKAYLGVNPQLCTGCRTCVLACSFEYFKVFNPERAHIGIVRHEERGEFDIIIKAGCVPCRVCQDSCPTGALTYREEEE